MRILLVNQFFWPDSAPTSQLLTDVARELASRGFEVHAVCGASQYAPDRSTNPPPVKVHRAPALRFKRGAAARVLSYATYLATATVRGLIMKRPDIVVTLTTPPLISMLGTLLKMFRGSRHFIWEMDVYPDVAIDVEYFDTSSMITRVVGQIADFSRRRADGIMVLGECMKERLMKHGIPAEKMHIAENWADGNMIQPAPHCQDHELRVLYSGNLGMAHEWETIGQAMAQVKDRDDLRFIFAGVGSRFLALQNWCKEQHLPNVTFGSRRDRSQLAQRLAEGDIGLVTQRTACVGSVVPSKVYGLMAAGRPILYIGPASATPARIIDRYGCGWHFENGDVQGVAKLLKTLTINRVLVLEAGKRSREAFDIHYEKAIGVARICSILGADLPVAGFQQLSEPVPAQPVMIATSRELTSRSLVRDQR